MEIQKLQQAVAGLVSSSEKVESIIEAGLVQDWVKTSRVLVLLKNGDDYGFLVCINSRSPITQNPNVVVERGIPINQHFKCEIDTSSQDFLGAADVYLKITYQKLKLLFELPYGTKTDCFIGDIIKATEMFSYRTGQPSHFFWLQKYNRSMNIQPQENSLQLSSSSFFATISEETVVKPAQGFEDNFSDFLDSQKNKKQEITNSTEDLIGNLDGVDEALPRESIAVGATPLAARESAVRLQMTMREEDYTDIQSFRIFCGTWNVNGQPPNIKLNDWLLYDSEEPDVYAIAFQELDLSKEAFLFNDTHREDEWLEAVTRSLSLKSEYKLVKLVRLVGMMLLVFIQDKHSSCVHNVCYETVGTGIMGKMGNKGGVSVRIDLHNTSICFVCSHLAAHVEEYERRNQDYADICSRMIFNQMIPPKSIKDHDQVYWLGDLNYRISDLDGEMVKTLAQKKMYSMLLEHDQLKIQHTFKNVYVGYFEGDIKFHPTYKYNPGTDDWDSSDKCRVPAWCDRILWKGGPTKLIEYSSHPSLRISDHKPVSAIFRSGVKVIDNTKYRKIYEEVMKKLDKLENEFLPQVTVDKMEVNFEPITFLELQTRCLTIANTGQVPVQFEFIKKPKQTSYCKQWFSIKPYTSYIMPGEKCDVDLELCVDKKSAYKLNAGLDKLYDILVLHLHNGKDLFITINGSYIPSSFGSSLEALVRMPHPIREVPVAQLVDLEKNVECNKEMDEPYEIPKEIWLLVDHLYNYGMETEELFQSPGLHSDIHLIRDRLDTGKPDYIPGSTRSVGESLLLLLEALPEPLIPYSFYSRCLECSNNFILCKQVVSQIPEVHKNTFKYLMAFLRELLHHSDKNKLDAKLTATVFSSIVLKPSPNHPAIVNTRRINQQIDDRKKATFIYHFLMNDYDD